MKLYIIGCGGVGSWLLPILVRLKGKLGIEDIVLFDGDKFEPKNLDRQLFPEQFVGRNKAQALASMYPDGVVRFEPQYLSPGWLREAEPDDWIIVAADNNAARKTALEIADEQGCSVLIAANEYTDAEAYVYKPDWRGTKADPRVLYPAILTDVTDDPLRVNSGCVEQSQQSPQLVAANVAAASFAADLLWYHLCGDAAEVDAAYHPVHHKKNIFKYTTINYENRNQ